MEELLLMVLLQIAVQNKSAVDINVALMVSTYSLFALRQATLTNGELALLLLVLGTCWSAYNREVGCGGSGFTPDVCITYVLAGIRS
jgi:hypothetical protein